MKKVFKLIESDYNQEYSVLQRKHKTSVMLIKRHCEDSIRLNPGASEEYTRGFVQERNTMTRTANRNLRTNCAKLGAIAVAKKKKWFIERNDLPASYVMTIGDLFGWRELDDTDSDEDGQ